MSACYQPWVHRSAVLTAALTLCLPILVGALVTTTDSGMSVQGWLTADGHPLLLYPWFQVAWDKFLEHGHRLAGVVVGLLSIGLAGVLFRYEPRGWVRGLGAAILGGVILQGVLGGQRVLLNAQGLAFLHGIFASWVFALMGCAAVVTSRGWHEAITLRPARWRKSWLWQVVAVCAAIAFQYYLGALVRHHGSVVHEHGGFAFLVLGLSISCYLSIRKARIGWLTRPAGLLVLLCLAQVLLGLAAFVVKYGGFGGYVVVYRSPLQIGISTGHVLLGMLVWLTGIVSLVRVWRVDRLTAQPAETAALALFPTADLGGVAG